MQRKHNLNRLVALITIFSAMVMVPQALAMSDKIIKQRIEDKANDTFRLNKGGRWCRKCLTVKVQSENLEKCRD